MNLQPMKQSPHPAMWVTVWCARCSGGTTDALADLDAKPGTYYCQPCALEEQLQLADQKEMGS